METSLKQLLNGSGPFFFESFPFPKALKILSLAPHPDDFDAVGMTLRRFRDNGNPVFAAIVTSGASGVEDSFCSPPTPEKKAAVREEEQRNSCRFFGLPDSHLTFLCLEERNTSGSIDTENNRVRLQNYLQQLQPDIVLLPHDNDTNATHRDTCAMARRIAVEIGFPRMALLNREPKTISMRHDFFTFFNKAEAAWKAELLRHHQSQHQRNLRVRNYGIDDRILEINQATAREYLPGKEYAEGFEIQFWGK